MILRFEGHSLPPHVFLGMFLAPCSVGGVVDSATSLPPVVSRWRAPALRVPITWENIKLSRYAGETIGIT